MSRAPNNLIRPRVAILMAMTADGKIATNDRSFSRFGSPADEARLYSLRTSADAILTGATTINKENATLTSPQSPTHPLRIIASASGSVPLSAPLFQTEGGGIILLTTSRLSPAKRQRYEAHTVGIHQSDGVQIDWPQALDWLARKWGVKQLLCEGGAELNQSLIEEDTVDELFLTVCPYIVGGSSAPAIAGGKGFRSLGDCPEWQLRKSETVESECFLHYHRKTSHRRWKQTKTEPDLS